MAIRMARMTTGEMAAIMMASGFCLWVGVEDAAGKIAACASESILQAPELAALVR